MDWFRSPSDPMKVAVWLPPLALPTSFPESLSHSNYARLFVGAGCENASSRARRRQPRQGRPICRKDLQVIVFKLRRSDIAHRSAGICRSSGAWRISKETVTTEITPLTGLGIHGDRQSLSGTGENMLAHELQIYSKIYCHQRVVSATFGRIFLHENIRTA